MYRDNQLTKAFATLPPLPSCVTRMQELRIHPLNSVMRVEIVGADHNSRALVVRKHDDPDTTQYMLWLNASKYHTVMRYGIENGFTEFDQLIGHHIVLSPNGDRRHLFAYTMTLEPAQE